MGMFDWYRPASVRSCPLCGALLQKWQGKDGPCGLFVWQEKEKHPVDQLVDQEVRMTSEDWKCLILPNRFRIYSHDCPRHQPIDAVGTTSDNVWTSTEQGKGKLSLPWERDLMTRKDLLCSHEVLFIDDMVLIYVRFCKTKRLSLSSIWSKNMTHPLHEKALELATVYMNSEARLLETLMLMAEENLFIRMGLTGIWEYVVKELKISESQAGYFERVAQRARVVPALKEAVLSGALSISKARRIVGVIDETNAREWILAAIELKQKDLERMVSEKSPRRAVREGFTPLPDNLSKLTVVVTEEEEKKIERAKNLLSQELQKPASLQETLNTAVTLFLDKKDPVKKALRASSRTRMLLNPQKTGRRAIPAQVKHQVHLRDAFRCTHRDRNNQRCEKERFLELHHINPVARGGENTLGNLTTRCFYHHRAEHL
jgi:hypothetical protein